MADNLKTPAIFHNAIAPPNIRMSFTASAPLAGVEEGGPVSISLDGGSRQAERSNNLTTQQAAKLMNISARTLEDWRYRGGGPVFRKMGRAVRYQLADIESFLDRCARINTAGAGP